MLSVYILNEKHMGIPQTEDFIMKKLLVGIALVVSMALIAACSGGSASGSAAAPAPAPAAASGAAGGSGAKIAIRAAHGAAENTGLHLGWLKFKEECEKISGGNITVALFPNQQLGGDREYSESVQMGDLTGGSPSSTPLAAFCKELYVLDIPFLFADRASAYAILDGAPGEALNEAMEKGGFKCLGHFENGFRNFTNSRNPVHKPEDVKGLKLRTMENPVHMEFWRLAGASPTPMAFGELFTALQQKTVDAQENPFELIYTAKFYEVQKYISETQHIYTPYVTIFNIGWWKGLDSKDQTVVQDAMKAAVQEGRNQAAKLDIEAKEKIVAAGVQVDSMTVEEKQTFRQAMSPVLKLVREKAGDAIVDIFVKAANYQ
jgi:tripartite ATP-independent transporter DctP family solute receptor